MDSVSNVSAKQRSGRSSGRSSSVRSSVSSATSARLREEANRAALVAKAAALKAKQALALKEAQLTVDKEQLEIETELAASNARIKVYAEYESPQQQVNIATMLNAIMQDDDEGQTRTGTSPSKLKYQKTTVPLTNSLIPKVRVDWRPNSVPSAESLHNDTKELCRVMKRQTDITELLVKNQQLSRLPQRDIPLFHGDPLEFRSFLKAFEHTIDSRAECDSNKLYFLEQYTRGDPKDLVRSCQHMPAHCGYRKALKLLHDRYRNKVKIASALMEKHLSGPKLNQKMAKLSAPSHYFS